MHPDAKWALQAIKARQEGIFDDPALIGFGLLSADTEADVTRIKAHCLRKFGFTVGDRDPRLNSLYHGAFMVVESHEESELPTFDGSNGPWCVVGDDLPELIDMGFDFLISCETED